MKTKAHNLLNPKVEDYYVKHFGRGKIPVARIGSKIIRGDKLQQILRAVNGSGSVTAAIAHGIDPEELQRCQNGKVLEVFAERGGATFPREGKRLPQRASDVDVALDLCYGAKGWLVCESKRIPFQELSESAVGFKVRTTAGEELEIQPDGCTVYRY